MSNEELLEELIREGTILARTRGEYSDYCIMGLYRAKRDIRLKMQRCKKRSWTYVAVDGPLPADDFEPIQYIEAHNQIYSDESEITLEDQESPIKGLEL